MRHLSSLIYMAGRLLKWSGFSLTSVDPLYHPGPLSVHGIGEYDGNMLM